MFKTTLKQSVLAIGLAGICFLTSMSFASSETTISISDYLNVNPEQTPSLFTSRYHKAQELVDQSYQQLLFSDFGQEVVQRILTCNLKMVIKHLGISLNIARLMVREICSNPKTFTHPWIYTIPDSEIEKVVSLRQKNQRSYRFSFINTNESNLLDSWTDFKTQTTTIYIDPQMSVLALRRKLLLSLAHETAIYFDQKAQLTSAHWSIHPDFKRYSLNRQSQPNAQGLDSLLTAANNPLIAQVLSYIRAFRVEKNWITQLPKKTLSKYHIDTKLYYNYRDFPFLSEECRTTCLNNYIDLSTYSISMFALPLLANSRYWSMKLMELSSQQPSDFTEVARRTLIDYKNSYVTQSLNHQRNNNEIFDSLEIKKYAHLTTQTFEQIFLPQDLKTLFEASLSTPPLHEVDATLFLTTPSLGNFGVEMASGPRPRIRTGSSYNLDFKDIQWNPATHEGFSTIQIFENGFWIGLEASQNYKLMPSKKIHDPEKIQNTFVELQPAKGGEYDPRK